MQNDFGCSPKSWKTQTICSFKYWNYHEKTQSFYTDFGLLTAHPILTLDTQMIFQQLTGLGKAIRLKEYGMRHLPCRRIYCNALINCRVAAQKGQKTEIIFKVND